MEVARHACALSRYPRKGRPGMTTLDAFVDFRDWHRRRARSRPQSFLSAVDEDEVLRFLKEPTTQREVRNLAFAYFRPAEYPDAPDAAGVAAARILGRHAREDLAIPRFLPWCAGGNYGCLLDGESNISLTGKIAHFELGYIPESAKVLRAVAGFLITNYTRAAHHHDAARTAEAERL